MRTPRWFLDRLTLICAIGAAPLTAQAPPGRGVQLTSPYLHLHHPAYTRLDLLLERGVIAGLSPLNRPWLRAEVARALTLADTANATGREREWLGELRSEFRQELTAMEAPSHRARLAGEIAVGATAMTDGHQDLLRPEGAGRTDVAYDLEGGFALPGVAGAAHLRADSRFVRDPQGRVTLNRWNQRAENAYVELQLPYVRLLLGRLYRNWAPSARAEGVLLSDYAPSYDQLALRVGWDRASITLMTARLDDFPGDSGDVHRFLALHRLDVRPSDNLALYLGEAVLYAGPNRNYELEFLNPLSFWFAENENTLAYRDVSSNNVLIGTGFWWRPSRQLLLDGDLVLDDIQVDRGAPNEPASYAFALGISLPRLLPDAVLRARYSQVANLAYRTPAAFEQYSFSNRGLARDFSDYDLLTITLDWFAVPSVVLTPSVEVLRRGEGDFRQPFPTDFAGVKTILEGTVERTVRLAVAGEWRPWSWGIVRWDAGWNAVANRGHTGGVSNSEFVARVTGRISFGGSTRLAIDR